MRTQKLSIWKVSVKGAPMKNPCCMRYWCNQFYRNVFHVCWIVPERLRQKQNKMLRISVLIRILSQRCPLSIFGYWQGEYPYKTSDIAVKIHQFLFLQPGILNFLLLWCFAQKFPFRPQVIWLSPFFNVLLIISGQICFLSGQGCFHSFLSQRLGVLVISLLQF